MSNLENTGQIVRSRKNGKSRYTPINNDICQSKILTCEQKSVLVHLLSLPENWVVYKMHIWKDMNIGRDRFNKAWVGLVELGYIVSIRMFKPNGQLKGYNHIVYEEPVLPDNQITENKVTEQQVTENQLPGNQLINKVIIQQKNNIESNNIKSNNILSNLESKLCIGLNITTKQLKQHISTDFNQYYKPEILEEYRELINQYRNE
jgi:hypothetical protein